MVGMNFIASPGIKGKHYIWLPLAHHLHQFAAQSCTHLDFPIIVTKKRYFAHTQYLGGMSLLLLTHSSKALHGHAFLVAASIAAGNQQVMNITALCRQTSYCTSADELSIIRMGHNH